MLPIVYHDFAKFGLPFVTSADSTFPGLLAEIKKGPNGGVVRPERLELPTYWFEASRSIQLSYGRTTGHYMSARRTNRGGTGDSPEPGGGYVPN
jgi:hypothetical protein